VKLNFKRFKNLKEF